MANRITMQFELETLSHVTLSSYHPVEVEFLVGIFLATRA